MAKRVKRPPPLALGLGFLGIGLALLLLAGFIAAYAVSEARIGRALAETGVPAQALVVSAERIERSQCSRSQRFLCQRSDNLIGTVVYEVEGLRVGTQIRLWGEEFDRHEAGEEVFIDLHYLPSAPQEVDRELGARLSSAQGDVLNIIVLSTFGLIFALIGGVTTLVARKGKAPPSTGRTP